MVITPSFNIPIVVANDNYERMTPAYNKIY